MMTALLMALASLIAVFGGALFGFFVQSLLPDHHLTTESRDVVKLGAGVIATVAALVLGLLVGSAKNTLDEMEAEVMQTAVKAMVLDQTLAEYGPETAEARKQLRASLAYGIGLLDHADGQKLPPVTSGGLPHGIHRTLASIRALSPQDDGQRWLQSRALDLGSDIQDDSWLLIEQSDNSLPMPFLIALVVSLAGIFASFSLFAPRNATTVTAMFFCALSVAASIFLIVEMDRPLGGLIQVSTQPLEDARARLGP
jgi:hypothetical protein